MQTDNKLKNQSGVCLHPFSFHYINKCLQLQESNFRMCLGVVMRMHNQIISEGLHQSHFEVGWRFEVAGSILRDTSHVMLSVFKWLLQGVGSVVHALGYKLEGNLCSRIGAAFKFSTISSPAVYQALI